jgi:acetylornithine aminotransferase
MMARFKAALAGDNRVREVRGQGLMLGIELAEAPERFVERALDARLLLNVTQGKVIRLLPPFILTDAEADTIVDQVVELIRS